MCLGPLTSVVTQVLAYWLLYTFDLFHYKTGAMVATRDDQEFEGKPGPQKAAGRLESKALESALTSTIRQASRLSQQVRELEFTLVLTPGSLLAGVEDQYDAHMTDMPPVSSKTHALLTSARLCVYRAAARWRGIA